jgi:hypothetical protein
MGSRLGRGVAFVRANGVKAGLEALFNFVLPFAIYSFASGRIGAAPALMAASAPPVLWSVAAFIRERRLDAISILVLSGIALSLVAFAGGGGVKVLQLRENLVGGLVGLVFLGSAVIGKPLIYRLARAGARRRSAEGVIEALEGDADFRRAMMVATLAWGFGLTGACAVNCALVFAVTIQQYLLIGGPISYAVIGALTAWTFWYVPRALRRATSRRTATIESAAARPDLQAPPRRRNGSKANA